MSFLRRLFGGSPGGQAGGRGGPGRSSVDLLCLAFSKKHGGRCVAGLDLESGRWLRPVSPQDDGTLFPRHHLLRDGSEPRVLDVLRIGLDRARPEPHQPENHLVSARPWQRVARRAETVAGLLAAAIDARPLILGTTGDRIPYSAAAASPLEASLALVRPREAVFVSTRSYSGHPQARLRFRHGGSGYYLSVTDPVWELEIAGRREGEYRHGTWGWTKGGCWSRSRWASPSTVTAISSSRRFSKPPRRCRIRKPAIPAAGASAWRRQRPRS